MTEQPPGQPRSVPPCPVCGGERVGNFILTGQYVGLQPRGSTVWLRPVTTVGAVVCLSCGYVELGALDLELVRRRVAEEPDRFIW